MAKHTATLVDTIGAFDLYEGDMGALFACPSGTTSPTGSAWGPAGDGTGVWFASRWLTESGGVRVADRAAAIAYITTEAVSG